MILTPFYSELSIRCFVFEMVTLQGVKIMIESS